MPRQTRGSIYTTRTGYGIRWPEQGRRPQKEGFRTKREARNWFDENVAPRLRRGTPSAEITFAAFCDLFLERHTGMERTKRTLADRLRPACDQFGTWTLRKLEGAADDIARWRAGLSSDSARYRHTRALRECLAAAVRWRYITANPAVDAGANPEPRQEEIRPFTRSEVDMVAVELGPAHGALVVFAAETGLRTHEWVALERRDVDRGGAAVVVQRRFSKGALSRYPKTATSRRRVPLTRRALQALDQLPPRLETPLLFPSAEGKHINLDNWRSRHWYPALEAAGVQPRGPYALRHSFATEALAAGVSIFQLARLMGSSVRMVDRTYGHLAHDSEGHLRELLSARSDTLVMDRKEQ